MQLIYSPVYFRHLSVPILFSKATNVSLYSSSGFFVLYAFIWTIWSGSSRFNSFFWYFIGRVTRIIFFPSKYSIDMKKIVCCESIAFLMAIFSIVGYAYGKNELSKSIVSQSRNSSTLESLIQNEINCTNSTECGSKSRRRRYAAFPEGSSFSV